MSMCEINFFKKLPQCHMSDSSIIADLARTLNEARASMNLHGILESTAEQHFSKEVPSRSSSNTAKMCLNEHGAEKFSQCHVCQRPCALQSWAGRITDQGVSRRGGDNESPCDCLAALSLTTLLTIQLTISWQFSWQSSWQFILFKASRTNIICNRKLRNS